MSEKQQTAVEWLENEFQEMCKDFGGMHIDFIERFEEAKAMEKEYLEQFYNQGYTQCSIEDLEPKSRERFVDAEDYYNKTFK